MPDEKEKQVTLGEATASPGPADNRDLQTVPPGGKAGVDPSGGGVNSGEAGGGIGSGGGGVGS